MLSALGNGVKGGKWFSLMDKVYAPKTLEVAWAKVRVNKAGALIAPLILLDRFTLAMFMPAGSEALEIARHLNHIAVWSFLFFGVTFVVAGVVRATGAVIPPLVILGLALWGVRVPFANWLQPHLGVDAIWWSFPVSAFASMVLSLAYYRWGNWREAKMLPVEPDAIAIPSEVPAQVPSPVADAGARCEEDGGEPAVALPR